MTKRKTFIQLFALATILFSANVIPVVAQPTVNNEQFATSGSSHSTSNSKSAVATFTLPVSNLALSTFNVQPKYEFRAAWIDPYRAVFDKNSSVASNHITRVHKDWFLMYGGKKYFNPGLSQVMQYVTNIVKDVVTRYDVDAIHMDDYFYPYRITGKEFPDEATYRKYGDGLNKEDWRRSNCDSIIKMIHNTIVAVKPMVKFGISPFGVWRNKSNDEDGSDTKAGQTNYDDLYADILLWLKKGWIDYVAPQLYWEIGNRYCDYETLLDWWSKHSFGKDVYIGHALYRTIEHPTAAWRNTNELPDEIKLLRDNKNVEGSIYFSASNFYSNPNGWADTLKDDYYSTPSLIPSMPWIDTITPKSP